MPSTDVLGTGEWDSLTWIEASPVLVLETIEHWSHLQRP